MGVGQMLSQEDLLTSSLIPPSRLSRHARSWQSLGHAARACLVVLQQAHAAADWLACFNGGFTLQALVQRFLLDDDLHIICCSPPQQSANCTVTCMTSHSAACEPRAPCRGWSKIVLSSRLG